MVAIEGNRHCCLYELWAAGGQVWNHKVRRDGRRKPVAQRISFGDRVETDKAASQRVEVQARQLLDSGA